MSTGAVITEVQGQAKQKNPELSTQERQKLLDTQEREKCIKQGTLLTPEKRLEIFAKLVKPDNEVIITAKGSGTPYRISSPQNAADEFRIHIEEPKTNSYTAYWFSPKGQFIVVTRTVIGKSGREVNSTLWAEKRADSWLKDANKAIEEKRVKPFSQQ